MYTLTVWHRGNYINDDDIDDLVGRVHEFGMRGDRPGERMISFAFRNGEKRSAEAAAKRVRAKSGKLWRGFYLPHICECRVTFEKDEDEKEEEE